jgi:gas vesicle protein
MKAFLVGMGAGIAVGLLCAPQEGKKTRATMISRFNDLWNRAGEEDKGQIELPEHEAVAEVLNTASKHELMSVEGVGKGTANRIIKNRPYETEEEVLQEGVLPEEILERVKEQLVDEPNVNVNKARDVA